MGTERDLIYQKPCSCGKGEFIVVECSPDHPWAKAHQTYYEYKIRCAACSSLFEIEYKKGKVYLITKTEIEKKKQTESEYHKKTRACIEYANRKGYLKMLRDKIDSMPSVAAIYRLLSSSGIHRMGTEATFRRNFKSYKDTQHWVGHNILYFDLPSVLTLLQVTDKQLSDMAKETNNLFKEMEKPPHMIEHKF